VCAGGGVDGDKEKNVKSNLQKTASSIVVESLDISPQHTHILHAALILPKESRG
jgi:hypothetical protein